MVWTPTASIELLKRRAHVLASIRSFFDKKGYLEVETPYMAKHGVTDVHLLNIKARFREQTYYLQTSPEYHMKRLLAAGSGPIFQLARVFRDDEFGRWHNPEFTLLEWYQLGVDHFYLIDEIQQLFKNLCGIDSFKHLTYQQAFEEACGLLPIEADILELQQVCKRYDLSAVLEPDESKDQHLHLLMAMVVEPYLAKTYSNPVVVVDFPASQASLAKVEGNIAHRFEIYWQGVELANGFHELTDVELQRQRFNTDLQLRHQMGIPPMTIDEQFLSALAYGLPACSGVALGIDRLLALMFQQDGISHVTSFSFPNL